MGAERIVLVPLGVDSVRTVPGLPQNLGTMGEHRFELARTGIPRVSATPLHVSEAMQTNEGYLVQSHQKVFAVRSWLGEGQLVYHANFPLNGIDRLGNHFYVRSAHGLRPIQLEPSPSQSGAPTTESASGKDPLAALAFPAVAATQVGDDTYVLSHLGGLQKRATGSAFAHVPLPISPSGLDAQKHEVFGLDPNHARITIELGQPRTVPRMNSGLEVEPGILVSGQAAAIRAKNFASVALQAHRVDTVDHLPAFLTIEQGGIALTIADGPAIGGSRRVRFRGGQLAIRSCRPIASLPLLAESTEAATSTPASPSAYDFLCTTESSMVQESEVAIRVHNTHASILALASKIWPGENGLFAIESRCNDAPSADHICVVAGPKRTEYAIQEWREQRPHGRVTWLPMRSGHLLAIENLVGSDAERQTPSPTREPPGTLGQKSSDANLLRSTPIAPPIEGKPKVARADVMIHVWGASNKFATWSLGKEILSAEPKAQKASYPGAFAGQSLVPNQGAAAARFDLTWYGGAYEKNDGKVGLWLEQAGQVFGVEFAPGQPRSLRLGPASQDDQSFVRGTSHALASKNSDQLSETTDGGMTWRSIAAPSLRVKAGNAPSTIGCNAHSCVSPSWLVVTKSPGQSSPKNGAGNEAGTRTPQNVARPSLSTPPLDLGPISPLPERVLCLPTKPIVNAPRTFEATAVAAGSSPRPSMLLPSVPAVPPQLWRPLPPLSPHSSPGPRGPSPRSPEPEAKVARDFLGEKAPSIVPADAWTQDVATIGPFQFRSSPVAKMYFWNPSPEDPQQAWLLQWLTPNGEVASSAQARVPAQTSTVILGSGFGVGFGKSMHPAQRTGYGLLRMIDADETQALLSVVGTTPRYFHVERRRPPRELARDPASVLSPDRNGASVLGATHFDGRWYLLEQTNDVLHLLRQEGEMLHSLAKYPNLRSMVTHFAVGTDATGASVRLGFAIEAPGSTQVVEIEPDTGAILGSPKVQNWQSGSLRACDDIAGRSTMENRGFWLLRTNLTPQVRLVGELDGPRLESLVQLRLTETSACTLHGYFFRAKDIPKSLQPQRASGGKGVRMLMVGNDARFSFMCTVDDGRSDLAR
jgi:hypothetical protein